VKTEAQAEVGVRVVVEVKAGERNLIKKRSMFQGRSLRKQSEKLKNKRKRRALKAIQNLQINEIFCLNV